MLQLSKKRRAAVESSGSGMYAKYRSDFGWPSPAVFKTLVSRQAFLHYTVILSIKT